MKTGVVTAIPLFRLELVVVYHLHAKTVWFTVQFRIVTSFRDWCLPFAQIPTIYREILELVSKMRFDKMEHEFLFGTFRPGKQNYLFRRSVIPNSVAVYSHKQGSP